MRYGDYAAERGRLNRRERELRAAIESGSRTGADVRAELARTIAEREHLEHRWVAERRAA